MKNFHHAIKIMSVALILIFGTILTGCGSTNTNEKNVAVCFPNTTPSWQRNGSALRDQLTADGFEVDMKISSSSEEQVQQVAEALKNHPKCVVIGAIDSSAFVDVLENAKAWNIPIIAFDRIIFNTDAVSYYASYDNDAVGEAQGLYFESALNLKNGGGPYNIELFAGAPSDNNAHLFFKNTMQILDPYFKTGQLVCQSKQMNFDQCATADWNSANARTRIKNLLSTYYNTGQALQVVLSPNDDIAGVILEEMKSRGMQKPLISGLDADPAAITRIKAG